MTNALQIFDYQSQQVRIVTIDDEPWLIAKDVCEFLGMTVEATRRLDDDEKGLTKIQTLGGMQDVTIINESGLYNLTFRSNKSEAKKFTKWVTFQKYPEARITYGSETVVRRKELELEKTHYNDAIAISGIEAIKENPDEYFYLKQFRKKKRSLHESIPRKGRKEPNKTQKRNAKNTKVVKGWYRNDCVRYQGKVGWIGSFSGTSAYVRDLNEESISEKKAIPLSRLELVCHNNNWQYGVRKMREGDVKHE